MNDLGDRLSPEMENLIATLPRERPVDPQRAHGIVARIRPRPRRRWMLEIAAAVAIALVAGAAGRASLRPSRANYVLFVHDDAPVRPSEALARFQEYSAWAASLRNGNHLAGGEELQDQRTILMSTQTVEQRSAIRDRAIGGYFLLIAHDDLEALALSRACPHLRHGGTVELRRMTSR